MKTIYLGPSFLFSVICVLLLALPSYAQHEQHTPPPPPQPQPQPKTETPPPAKDTVQMPPMKMDMEMDSMSMTAWAIVPGVPHARAGSGTSWLPDRSTPRAFHWPRGEWMVMLHGMASLRYTNQDVSGEGVRGDNMVDGPNWAMVMGQRAVGTDGQVTLRAMMSLDRVTEGGDGYPLLFQSGESWQGQALVDRQHPHDLFMELAAAYGRRVGANGYFVYFGLPGEPALGPPAFMHRPSARNMIDAPLAHHWQDATHIAFGVLTGGFVHRNVMFDASVFTGREPDENRWNFDEPKFDSYAGRISYNPTAEFALQASAGRLHSPEALEPGIDVTRMTASLLYHHPLREGRLWTTALVWGANDPSEGKTTHSFLAESDWETRVVSPYGRLQVVQKSGEDLRMPGNEGGTNNIGTLTLGGAVTLVRSEEMELTAHVQGSGYAVPEALQGAYGKRPWSVEVYLQLVPAKAGRSMGAGESMEEHGH